MKCDECKFQSDDVSEFYITGDNNQFIVCGDCKNLGNNLMEAK